jgi:hypothetical protein
LLAVSEPQLLASEGSLFHDISETTIGKRLTRLIYVLDAVSIDKSLTPEIIFRLLVTPRYKQGDGWYLDVVSVIQMDEVNNEMLLSVADAALKHIRS